MINLQDIPGVGDKMAQRLIKHFGNEEITVTAILDGDIASICEIEGISHRFAVSLVHEARAISKGKEVSEFLKTREARDIYEKVLEIIKGFAPSKYAREKLNIYLPYPSSQMQEIESVRQMTSEYTEIARKINFDPGFMEKLAEVRPLSLKYPRPKIRDRVLITANSQDFEYARQQFSDSFSVQLVELPDQLIDAISGYSHIICSHRSFLEMEFPSDVDPEFISDLRQAEEWQIIPENTISFFAHNLHTITASLEVVRTVKNAGYETFEHLGDIDPDRIEHILLNINETGSLRQGIDPEIDRLRLSIEHMDRCIQDAVKDATSRISRILEDRKLTLSGQDMVRAISGEIEIRDMLEREIYHSYMEVVRDTKKRIASELELDQKSIILLDSVFFTHITYPLEIDKSAVRSLRQQLEHKLERKTIEHIRKVARDLHQYIIPVRSMVKEVLDFQVGFAIGHFSCEYDLSMPVLIENTGIGFRGARNLFLSSSNTEITPIDYSVGDTSFSPEDNSESVVILSGVNSGGKTSLLDLIAQCTVLAHMGLPVPCLDMEIGPCEKMYYFAKSKGTLDAGAFESTLVEFSSVADPTDKIVLVDELESITEPGASARIIAGILEMLAEKQNSAAIFVSHLPELIMENTECNIRVDGIEAEGLDAELNLVVDRNPRYNYIARSTPELIVERLARRTEGNQKIFYEKLRNKFHDS
ncbi:DNA mismatch repair protein MutS domain protein [Methanosalsum zhilinae DSM 4017]|uniref:DNA-binding protein MutS2 n=1 Tax=Methanosalsum zhilinae (strain DSM 4017 / NBRC 107636 / OCM 62 / WeN5) TaxID=679901 RepID=F7XMV8_METZD|nr:helix-hairpin-helix domain-containing protein [Methanosalsum zhilinae]AEH59975.1 DNA mismatch repair protein MutS domain protein [Methanosalsum zhilinae DSM 4017]